MIIEYKIDSLPSISSISEKEYIKQIGSVEWELIRKHGLVENKNIFCACCKYVPKANQKLLQIHIIEHSNDLKNVKLCLLCEPCHMLKHFDVMVKQGWVSLVNSTFSQEYLSHLMRQGTEEINKMIENKKIMFLKKTADEYLVDIMDIKRNITKSKIKFLFKKK